MNPEEHKREHFRANENQITAFLSKKLEHCRSEIYGVNLRLDEGKIGEAAFDLLVALPKLREIQEELEELEQEYDDTPRCRDCGSPLTLIEKEVMSASSGGCINPNDIRFSSSMVKGCPECGTEAE